MHQAEMGWGATPLAYASLLVCIVLLRRFATAGGQPRTRFNGELTHTRDSARDARALEESDAA